MFEGWDGWDFWWLIYWAMLLPGWLVSARMLKAISREENPGEKFIGVDYAFFVFMGFGLAWCWPIAVPAALVYKAIQDD